MVEALDRLFVGDARYPVQLCRQQFVGSGFDQLRHVGVAGPPWGGLYLKPPSSGGLCEGVTMMPSARPAVRPRFVVIMAWEITGVGVWPVLLVETDEPRLPPRPPMRFVEPERKGHGCPVRCRGAGRPHLAPVLTDGLRDGWDMRFIECALEGRAAMPARAEAHPLLGISRIGQFLVIGLFECVECNELFGCAGCPARDGEPWIPSGGCNDGRRIDERQYIRLDRECQWRAWLLRGPWPGC